LSFFVETTAKPGLCVRTSACPAWTMMIDEDFVFGGDGYTADQLFGVTKQSCYAYTYDDIIILPGHVKSDCTEPSLENNITRNIRVKIPLLSSPMDTVTEHQMAIGMALQGAIGVIHYNMTIAEQVKEVRLVKTYKNGFITDPACLSPENTVADVDRLKEQHGFSGIPITVDGKMGSRMVGIVCYRDVDYLEDRETKLQEVMTTELFTGEASYTYIPYQIASAGDPVLSHATAVSNPYTLYPISFTLSLCPLLSTPCTLLPTSCSLSIPQLPRASLSQRRTR
jgi:IMP dehydrogenase/GMP reductase